MEKKRIMAKPKTERNRLFIEDWKRGLKDRALAEKYNMTMGGVKALKGRLREKDPSLYVKKKPNSLTKVEKEVARASGGLIQFAGKIKKASSALTSTQTSASTSTKRMTFWLEEGTIEGIKGLALQEGKTASQIAREVFKEYLK